MAESAPAAAPVGGASVVGKRVKASGRACGQARCTEGVRAGAYAVLFLSGKASAVLRQLC